MLFIVSTKWTRNLPIKVLHRRDKFNYKLIYFWADSFILTDYWLQLLVDSFINWFTIFLSLNVT